MPFDVGFLWTKREHWRLDDEEKQLLGELGAEALPAVSRMDPGALFWCLVGFLVAVRILEDVALAAQRRIAQRAQAHESAA